MRFSLTSYTLLHRNTLSVDTSAPGILVLTASLLSGVNSGTTDEYDIEAAALLRPATYLTQMFFS